MVFQSGGVFSRTEKIAQIRKLFLKLAAKERKTGSGQLPDFVDSNNLLYFDIRFLADHLSYLSKWCPNTNGLVKLVDYLDCGAVHRYQEISAAIYGETIYQNGQLIDVCLDRSDFFSYTYNSAQHCFHFQGHDYQDVQEVLEILLRSKKNCDR